MFGNECPYSCNNGKIFNPALRQLVDCPHCSKIRKDEVRNDRLVDSGESLCETLNIRKSLTGLEFSINTILPEYARSFLVPDSVDKVAVALEHLTDKAVLGEKPACSYLFNLGAKANIDAFIYQYFMKAYKAGLSVCKYLYASDVYKLRIAEEEYDSSEEAKDSFSYSDILNKDICAVLIDTGATYKDIRAVAGLMQLRARNNLPTLIFTLCYTKDIFNLVYDSDENLLHLAKWVSVEYLRGEVTEQQRGVSQMSPEEFDNLFRNRNSL